VSLELPPDPYEILDIVPGASSAEIAASMARAMKARKHDARVIAEAQRTLLDPVRRALADFMRPVLPEVHRWKRFDLSGLDLPDEPDSVLQPLPAMNDLDAAIRELEELLDDA
jgi:hypothetical protein